MVPEYLKEETKHTLVLFDMDGVVAEFNLFEDPKIKAHVPGVYLEKRPIYSVLKSIDELRQNTNIEIGILSSCEIPSQKEEKIKWVSQFLPFIKLENIHVIIFEEENYTKENKRFAKVELIQRLTGFEKYYLIEDRHEIIKATNSIFPFMAHHVSEFLD